MQIISSLPVCRPGGSRSPSWATPACTPWAGGRPTTWPTSRPSSTSWRWRLSPTARWDNRPRCVSLTQCLHCSVGRVTETSSGQPTSAPRGRTGRGPAKGTAAPVCRLTPGSTGSGYSTEWWASGPPLGVEQVGDNITSAGKTCQSKPDMLDRIPQRLQQSHLLPGVRIENYRNYVRVGISSEAMFSSGLGISLFIIYINKVYSTLYALISVLWRLCSI